MHVGGGRGVQLEGPQLRLAQDMVWDGKTQSHENWFGQRVDATQGICYSV